MMQIVILHHPCVHAAKQIFGGIIADSQRSVACTSLLRFRSGRCFGSFQFKGTPLSHSTPKTTGTIPPVPQR